MGLKVRTATGQDFWRCGIKFGKDPIIVPDRVCEQPFGSPNPKGCIGNILLDERMLVCEKCGDEPEPAGDGDGLKPDPAGDDKAKGKAKAK